MKEHERRAAIKRAAELRDHFDASGKSIPASFAHDAIACFKSARHAVNAQRLDDNGRALLSRAENAVTREEHAARLAAIVPQRYTPIGRRPGATPGRNVMGILLAIAAVSVGDR